MNIIQVKIFIKKLGYIVGTKTDEGYRYGYLNNKQKEILPLEYNQISRVKQIEDKDNAYLVCAKDGKYGLNKNSETIIGNEYQSIEYDENNNVFVIEKSKKYGIANIDGKVVIPAEYDQIDITGIYLYAKNSQGTTVYNTNGTQVNIDVNTSISNTTNDKYKIRIINEEESSKYGVINQKGEQLIEEKYNYIKYLYDNYFIASYENGKLGILDDKENVKIELDNDFIQQIPNTKLVQATITDTKTVKLYSEKLEKIYEMSDATIEIEDNYIRIYNNKETKYFNNEGKEIKSTEVYPNNKLFLKSNGEKFGYVDANGNVVVEYIYDNAYELNEYGFAAVEKDGKWGAINSEGKEVIAPTYEFSENAKPSFIGQYYKVVYGFGEVYYTNNK